MAEKKESKKVRRAQARRKMYSPKITKSKEHRGCGPIGYYLRFGYWAKRG